MSGCLSFAVSLYNGSGIGMETSREPLGEELGDLVCPYQVAQHVVRPPDHRLLPGEVVRRPDDIVDVYTGESTLVSGGFSRARAVHPSELSVPQTQTGPQPGHRPVRTCHPRHPTPAVAATRTHCTHQSPQTSGPATVLQRAQTVLTRLYFHQFP